MVRLPNRRPSRVNPQQSLPQLPWQRLPILVRKGENGVGPTRDRAPAAGVEGRETTRDGSKMGGTQSQPSHTKILAETTQDRVLSESSTIRQEHAFPVRIDNEGAPQDREIYVRLARSEQPRTSARFLPNLQTNATGSSSRR